MVGIPINIQNRFDRKVTGFLATLVATHAISNNGEPALHFKCGVGFWFPIGEMIFVVFALAPDVRKAGGFNSGSNVHGLCRRAGRDSHKIGGLSNGR